MESVWRRAGERLSSGSSSGETAKRLGSQDIRFTRNKAGDVVYAIVMGWPGKEAQFLGTGNRKPALAGQSREGRIVWLRREGRISTRRKRAER